MWTYSRDEIQSMVGQAVRDARKHYTPQKVSLRTWRIEGCHNDPTLLVYVAVTNSVRDITETIVWRVAI